MKELDIVYLSPDELIPYPRNAKQHPEEQVEHIANSIREFGFRQPIVVDADNVVVIGHGRLMAAKKLGLESVPVARADDLTEEQIKALRLADNKTNESDWDFTQLEAELAELELDFDMGDFGFDEIDTESVESKQNVDDKYSHEIKIPQYVPSENPPKITQLIDTRKLNGMLQEIEEANLTREEKEFLRIAAYRHAVIDFDKVADYYAVASQEMQALMERSALVIIDIDDAIANGYVQLSSALESIMVEDEG